MIVCLFPPEVGETDRVGQRFLGKEAPGPPASVTAGGGLVVGPTESESLEVTQRLSILTSPFGLLCTLRFGNCKSTG